jgi:hypothetical protein
MASLFKPLIVRYVDSSGSRVPKGTPGARRFKEKASRWYGQYVDAQGIQKQVPLSTDKTAARQILNDRARRAELNKAGLGDPYEAHRTKPLLEHLADFESSLLAKGNTAKQSKQVASRVRRVVNGCKFIFLGDLSASQTLEYLATLRDSGRALPPLDPDQQEFTRTELSTALGIGLPAITKLISRHNLAASGEGKARRFPRETVEFLLDRPSRGLVFRR